MVDTTRLGNVGFSCLYGWDIDADRIVVAGDSHVAIVETKHGNIGARLSSDDGERIEAVMITKDGDWMAGVGTQGKSLKPVWIGTSDKPRESSVPGDSMDVGLYAHCAGLAPQTSLDSERRLQISDGEFSATLSDTPTRPISKDGLDMRVVRSTRELVVAYGADGTEKPFARDLFLMSKANGRWHQVEPGTCIFDSTIVATRSIVCVPEYVFETHPDDPTGKIIAGKRVFRGVVHVYRLDGDEIKASRVVLPNDVRQARVVHASVEGGIYILADNHLFHARPDNRGILRAVEMRMSSMALEDVLHIAPVSETEQ
jgi:hypothetical protein